MTQAQDLFDLDDLPIPQRLAAQALGYGLDCLSARHHPSWEAGMRAGIAKATQSSELKIADPVVVKLTLGYIETDQQSTRKDTSVFGGERIQLPAEARSAMRDACSRNLNQREQPTGEQWKIILSTTQSSLMTGAAGTGKTRTLLFRALFLNQFCQVPLNQIQILTFSKEARLELAVEMQELFKRFSLDLPIEDCLAVVKTPRSSLLSHVRSLPDLSSVIPFEVYGLSQGDISSLADGRPYEAGLTAQQREEMTKCLNLLYRTNKRFAEMYLALWSASLRLQTLEVDSPEVVKRAPLGWKLSEYDTELCDVVERLWRSAKAWPIAGITAGRKTFTLRGRTYSTHGFIPQLGLYVVLGFDRSEGPTLTRGPSAKVELYKEVAIKRTLLQAYFQDGLLHLDSYQDAAVLGEALRLITNSAPPFSYALKGESAAVALLDSFNSTATLLDSLGLEISSLPGRMNFLPDDSDSTYFEVLSVYWQALERHLLALPKPVIPFGRLFSAFAGDKKSAIRHVPNTVLDQCRHLLIDGSEDQPVPVTAWVKSLLTEIRRRDIARGIGEGQTSLVVAGDSNQWSFGSYGASPRLLTEFDDHFQTQTAATKVALSETFRSPQSLIDAAFNIVQNLNSGHSRAPKSVTRAASADRTVKIMGDHPSELEQLCDVAAAANQKILVLIVGESDKEWVDAAIGDRIRQDRSTGGKGIRVRSFHKAKALEADVVVLVGDPAAGISSWYRNQLFKLAGFSSGGDLTPGDTVLKGEALRLTHVAITRARLGCYWFPNRPDSDGKTASTMVSLLPGLFEDRR